MGVLGELFPGRKILDEAGEAGDGQPWRLGPIDLEAGVVTVRRMPSPEPAEPDKPAEPDERAEPASADDSVDD